MKGSESSQRSKKERKERDLGGRLANATRNATTSVGGLFFVEKASGEKGCKPTPPRTFLPRQSAGELAVMVLYRHCKREGTREVVGVLEREGREAVGAFRPRFLLKKKSSYFFATTKREMVPGGVDDFFFPGKKTKPHSHTLVQHPRTSSFSRIATVSAGRF